MSTQQELNSAIDQMPPEAKLQLSRELWEEIKAILLRPRNCTPWKVGGRDVNNPNEN